MAVPFDKRLGWLPEEDAALKKRLSEGGSISGAAAALGRTVRSVHRRARKLGFKLPDPICESVNSRPGPISPGDPIPCMCCRITFQSQGKHNRLCELCRRREAEPDEYRVVR